MSPGMQNTLLGMRWKEICDSALPVPSEPLKSSCAWTRPTASEAPIRYTNRACSTVFLGKTDIEVEASLYTHRKSALVLINAAGSCSLHARV
jgi:hypothetical protein